MRHLYVIAGFTGGLAAVQLYALDATFWDVLALCLAGGIAYGWASGMEETLRKKVEEARNDHP